MFCEKCDGILNARFEPLDFDGEGNLRSAGYNHHETLSSLQASIEEGCLVCCRLSSQIILNQIIQSSQQDDENFFTSARIMHSISEAGTEEATNDFSLIIFPRGQSWGSPLLELRFLPLSDAAIDSSYQEIISYRRFVSGSTNTQESERLIANWLNICEQKHTKCFPHKGTDWYPTRLLDLGGLSDTPIHSIRIIESQRESPIGPYVTLSHRWGGSDVFKLTKTTYANLRSGIKAEILPRTFRDAISATKRGLAVRYLWIDSLCIFQDPGDQSDWLKEALTMDKVYENAFCNLLATGAEDSSQGLFFNRRPEQSQPAEVTLTLSHFDPSASACLYLMVEETASSRQLESTPLLRRGWVIQERMLARRNLHFCCDQLIWECKESYASETYPEGINTGRYGSPWMTLLNGDPYELGIDDDEFEKHFHETWAQIVFRYSECELTLPTDKIIALSGVAKRMREILQDEYVLGMWRRPLPYQLLWTVYNSAENVPCSQETCRSPSFSWFSTEGAVSIGRRRDPDSILFSVEEIRLEYETTDTTGPVKSGHIILHGFVRPMSLHDDTHEQVVVAIDGITMNVLWFSLDHWTHWTRLRRFASESSLKEPFKSTSLDVYCLIARRSLMTYDCLILDYVSSGKFKRIGICAVGPIERVATTVKQFRNEPSIPCTSYSIESKKSTLMLI